MSVRDITQDEFQTAVVEASHQRPVVVDFWAPWCGPCHRLSPLLEQAADRHAADVDTVKLNVDEAPAVAQQLNVRGIPAVKAFKDGKVVGEFVGVQPDRVIEQLFAGLGPSEADRLVAQAQEDPGQAEVLLRKALAADASHPGAVLGIALLLIERGETDEARGLLGRIPADPEARRLLGELSFGTGSPAAEDLDALAAAADAGDAAASLQLGRALAAGGDHAEALRRLVAAAADPATREDARDTALRVFDVLGADHELVRAWRPKLAAALF